MTLTKDQRYYRKKKKESQRDFKRTTFSTGNPAVHVTQKKLSARVTHEAFERLKEQADKEGKTRSEVLERMLIQGLPSYCSPTTDLGTNRYHWDEPIEPKTHRRKGKGGQKQLNLWVSSTAWKKLEVHADTIGESKSRILDRLLKEYRFLSEEGKERNRRYEEDCARRLQEWKERVGIAWDTTLLLVYH